MSIVARVFVVLNLVMSVVFIVFAIQTWVAPTKWEIMYEKERKANIEQKFTAQPRLVALNEDAVRKEALRDIALADAKALRTLLSNMGDQLVKTQGELSIAKAQARIYEDEAKQKDDGLAAAQQQVVKLKDVIIKQQQAVQIARDNEVKMRAERIEFENESNLVKQQLVQMQKELQATGEQLELASRRIEFALEHGVPPEMLLGQGTEMAQTPLPPAKILGVMPELDLVIISIGSKAGVKLGYKFSVSRGSEFLAQAQVDKVYDNMCSARLTLKKGQVQMYDDVKASSVP